MVEKNCLMFLGSRFDAPASVDDAATSILNERPPEFRYVVTPNVLHMVRLHENPELMQPLIDRAWRVFCDSRVLSRLARLSGLRLPVVTGSDLTKRIIERAAVAKMEVAIVGPSTTDCELLASKYPGLVIRSYTPPMGFISSAEERQKCIDFVVRTNAPVTFLAVGMPQQEIIADLICRHPEARGIGLCIGASIDFLTGKQRRAPEWMQKAGVEWFYRLMSNPRRLANRYVVECPKIFYLMLMKGRPR